MNIQDVKLDIRTAAVIVSTCFAIFFFFDAKYAYNAYVQEVETELHDKDRELQEALLAQEVRAERNRLEAKQEQLQNDLNRDHFARRQYEEQIKNNVASPRDMVRYEYLLLQIDSKTAEKETIDRQLADLTLPTKK